MNKFGYFAIGLTCGTAIGSAVSMLIFTKRYKKKLDQQNEEKIEECRKAIEEVYASKKEATKNETEEKEIDEPEEVPEKELKESREVYEELTKQYTSPEKKESKAFMEKPMINTLDVYTPSIVTPDEAFNNSEDWPVETLIYYGGGTLTDEEGMLVDIDATVTRAFLDAFHSENKYHGYVTSGSLYVRCPELSTYYEVTLDTTDYMKIRNEK